MKNYDRDTIIAKLSRHGLKPVFQKNSRQIKHFKKANPHVTIGIKMWGYLDFLNVRVI